MNLRVTPRALAEAKRLRKWWRRHRPLSPELFDQELDAAIELILSKPDIGAEYKAEHFDVTVRRVLLRKTKNHIYYAVEASDLVILSVWGGPRGRGPKL
jgi:plasmid stabilization system protein ParE